MTNEIVPAVTANGDSEGDGQHAEHGAGPQAKRTTTRRRRDTRILTREDCLRQLSQLPSLVAMKIMTPAEANSISKSLQIVLAETRTVQSVGVAQVADENILRLLRAQPELVHLLEPLLTDEQIEMIMNDVTDDESEA